jgi:hypothetical protein
MQRGLKTGLSFSRGNAFFRLGEIDIVEDAFLPGSFEGIRQWLHQCFRFGNITAASLDEGRVESNASWWERRTQSVNLPFSKFYTSSAVGQICYPHSIGTQLA